MGNQLSNGDEEDDQDTTTHQMNQRNANKTVHGTDAHVARAAASPVAATALRTARSPAAPNGNNGNIKPRSSFEALTKWLSGSPCPQSPPSNGCQQPQADPADVNVTVARNRSDNSSSIRRTEDFYEVQNIHIGRGHYAVVCRGTCKRTGRPVAVKKIKRFLTDEKRLKAEICVLRRVKKHPNIVELIDVFETAREVHLVMELCTGGELFERLADKGPYSEADCVRHITDMARAVLYLHENGIVHRDLKPENILLSTPNDGDAVIKVADFGLAKVFTGTNMKTKCGTWGYSAPEMISGSGITFGYDCKVDSWSLGTILYILLCGFHPFDPNGTSSDNEMISCIKNCQFDFEDEAWDGISEGAKDLIQHLLVLDPANRFTMKELLDHPWITGANMPPSSLPLSPTIHRDLAKFREQTKQKMPFDFMEMEDEEH